MALLTILFCTSEVRRFLEPVTTCRPPLKNPTADTAPVCHRIIHDDAPREDPLVLLDDQALLTYGHVDFGNTRVTHGGYIVSCGSCVMISGNG
ncbi:hypothetical protein CY34DRAFT_807443 [Suillus luteus UH-Slu-Lm8-n1]|uniref:Uncharacterized protein n=1 Tax=Suillus luteus UH-Slu-Lm8-n1 TaxID=930992 RepID=A0A0D0AEU5_9AGAM|nr:hypothetical protein CY34DRAFT_807443 [Suillus luteus UH-Slu-Lm8-n1]